MAARDRIRLTGLLQRSPAAQLTAGLLHVCYKAADRQGEKTAGQSLVGRRRPAAP